MKLVPARLVRRALTTAVVLLAVGVTSATAATPVETQFAAVGPYATTTGTITDASGAVVYDTFYPSNYAALGFASPIVTWGNGTNATPTMYTTLLRHLASYGFTVVAPVATNTGSGRSIDAAAQKMVALNATAGSVFAGHLDTAHVGAAGHSQGAGGATRAATNDPSLITALLTFSLPNTTWIGTNPDCPTKADCTYDPSRLTQPVLFIGTRGFSDSIIASPATQTAFYNSVPGHAAVGIVSQSDGRAADHNSIQDAASGGNPGGELGYATAWLLYRLRGDATAAQAFSGTAPELLRNTNWSSAAVK